MATLTQRRDFLAAARARWAGTTSVTLQARKRALDEADPEIVRVGFTCSKKVGNAVARNRAKRRLRAAARAVLGPKGRPGWDYVLIGRPNTTVNRPYGELLYDLRLALTRVHTSKKKAE